MMLTAVGHVFVSTICIHSIGLTLPKAVEHSVIKIMRLFDMHASHVVFGIVVGNIVYVRSTTSFQRCGNVCCVVNNECRRDGWFVLFRAKTVDSVRAVGVKIVLPKKLGMRSKSQIEYLAVTPISESADMNSRAVADFPWTAFEERLVKLYICHRMSEITMNCTWHLVPGSCPRMRDLCVNRKTYQGSQG